MSRQLLKCDICGGTIEIQTDGKSGVCENCGATYSLDRMRQMYSDLKVSITGSVEDVAQWEMLLERYMGSFDYASACEISEKILQAQPDNNYVYELHTKLIEWKNLEVDNNGKLIRYHGHAENLELPMGLKAIGGNAFGCKNAGKRNSNSIIIARRIADAVQIKSIVIPSSVEVIESPEDEHMGGAFAGCDSLKSVVLSDGLREIGAFAFSDCQALESISIPESVKVIGDSAFEGCENISGCIDIKSVTSIGTGAFFNCRKVTEFVLGNELKQVGYNSLYTFGSTQIDYSGDLNLDEATGIAEQIRRQQKAAEEERRRAEERSRIEAKQKAQQQAYWRGVGLCQYCGGTFKGLLSKKCASCGRTKDY